MKLLYTSLLIILLFSITSCYTPGDPEYITVEGVVTSLQEDGYGTRINFSDGYWVRINSKTQLAIGKYCVLTLDKVLPTGTLFLKKAEIKEQ